MVRVLKGSTSGNYDAKITHLDPSQDLAILQLDRAHQGNLRDYCFRYAKLERVVSIGEKVDMVVTSDATNFMYSQGTVEFEDRLFKDISNTEEIGYFNPNAKLMQIINLHGIPGSSGAPVFDVARNLIGIYSNGNGRRDFLVPTAVLELYVS